MQSAPSFITWDIITEIMNEHQRSILQITTFRPNLVVPSHGDGKRSSSVRDNREASWRVGNKIPIGKSEVIIESIEERDAGSFTVYVRNSNGEGPIAPWKRYDGVPMEIQYDIDAIL